MKLTMIMASLKLQLSTRAQASMKHTSEGRLSFIMESNIVPLFVCGYGGYEGDCDGSRRGLGYTK
jgi:hypothetical protein